MPQVTQEQYEQLERIGERAAKKKALREAQKVVLKKYDSEVQAELTKSLS